jgi:arylformamidase
MEWTDISVPLKSGMAHWPGDPPVRIEKVRYMAQGDEANLTTMAMGSHSGTHMDAPCAF